MPLYRAELRRRKCLLPPVLIHDLSQMGYWPFDHDDGDYARDRSGHVNHGTLYGPTRVAGKVAGALSFDGENDQVDIADADSLDVTRITMALWVKLANINKEQWLMQKWGPDTFSGIYSLSVDSSNRILFRISIGETIIGFTSTVVLSKDIWYFIAATYDGAYMRIYVDTAVKSQAQTGDIDVSAEKLTLGRRKATGSEIWLDGVLDEIRIYNRALSAAEIQRVTNIRGI